MQVPADRHLYLCLPMLSFQHAIAACCFACNMLLTSLLTCYNLHVLAGGSRGVAVQHGSLSFLQAGHP